MKKINPLSSAEIGTLWLTYQEKTMILRVLEYFIEKSDDQQAKNIMGGLWQNLHYYIKKIESIFESEGAAVPVGFTNDDVNLEAPKLYDHGFDIMFVRILKEVSMGMYTINMNMAYRDDLMELYEGLTRISQKVYKLSTLYLLERGILTLPPTVSLPKTNEFIETKSYLKGLMPFRNKRPLNDIEIGILHHGIETNNIGIQLITGFAQCAEDKEIKDYFIQGRELAKKHLKTYQDILAHSEVQFHSGAGSTVTTSKIAPFSQKLMMFCIYLLNGYGIVGNSFGTMFSFRNDLSLKTTLLAKDTYFFAHEGVKLMIKNRWMEEPPQMEDRSDLVKE
ncbi:DUF3231 family protein [Neobacillus sp. PS3-34]|uniref:DUF3231 family protein n=1 Tax=Neobacillus sp. PS3-34 TaxID=3070678 RepID=UPI0027E09E84|nr:DUF3231 family protein [Neobacillus sp. PS3-34]WML48381.1 DUF3231 family protein [Neobacillus sp. PS3-34]